MRKVRGPKRPELDVLNENTSDTSSIFSQYPASALRTLCRISIKMMMKTLKTLKILKARRTPKMKKPPRTKEIQKKTKVQKIQTTTSLSKSLKSSKMMASYRNEQTIS